MADDRTIRVRLLAEIQSYLQGMRQAGAATTDFGRQVSGMGSASSKDIERVGHSAGIASLAIASAFGFAIHATLGFDKQISELGAAAGASGDDLGRLRQAALDAGAATAFSASEAAEAETELAKAGVSTADILGGALSGALDLAASGSLGLGDAAGIAAQTMTTFGLRGRDVGRIADALAAGATKSVADVSTLSQALAQSGLVADQYGLSMEETVGVLSLFSQNALNGSDAGTSFKTMLLKLGAPTAQAKELMNQLGIEVYGASGQMLPFADVADSLKARLSGLSEEQRNAALSTIFGTDAIRAANIIYQSGGDGVRQWTDDVSVAGYASDIAGQKLDNLSGDLEALSGSIETALIENGSKATSVLRSLTQGATEVVTGFSELPDWLQYVGLGLGGVATTGLGAVGVLGTLAPKVKDARKALEGMGTAGQFLNRNLGTIATGVGAASAAVAIYSAVVANHAKTEQEAADGTKAWIEVIESQTGSLRANAAARIEQSAAEAGVADDLGRLKISYQDVGAHIVGSREATLAWMQSLQAAGGVSNDFGNYLFKQRGQLENATAEMVQSIIASGKMSDTQLLAAASVGQTTDAAAELERILADGVITNEELSTSNVDLGVLIGNLGGIAAEASGDVDTLSGAEEHQQEVTRELTDDIKELADAIESSLGNQLSLTEAHLSALDAIDEYNATVADGTKTERERQQAQVNLEQSILSAADAAKKAASDEAIASGNAAGAAKVGTDAQIAYLQGLASQFAPGSPVRTELDGFIVALQSIPDEQHTVVSVSSNAHEVVAGILHDLSSLQAATPNIRIPVSSGRDLPGLVVANGNAAGGWAGMGRRGPTDTIPAWLTPNEFVINARSAKAIGSPLLHALNATGFATGGFAGALNARANQGAALALVSGSTAGQSVIAAASDAAGSKSAVDSLTDAYLRLRDAVGETTASEVLFAAQSADDFDRLAAGAEDAMGRMKVMYETGALSGPEYVAALQEQLAGQERFSDGWYSTWQEILRVETDSLDKQRDIEDARYELGLDSNDERRKVLVDRLAGEKLFSQEYMQTWRDLQDFDEQQRKYRLDQERQRLDDLTARRGDLQQLFIEAHRQSAETGEDWQAILERLQQQAAADESLQAEAQRYALQNTPRVAPGPADFIDARSLHAWSQVGGTMPAAGSSTTIVAFPDATIRETVDMTAAWQQVAALRLQGSL